MAAPVPKPQSIKDLFGNPGGRKRNDEAPEPIQELYPQPPDSLHAEAKAVWAELAQDLVVLKLLTRIDKRAFARYCFKLWQWHRAADFIAANGTAYPVYEEVALVDARGVPMFHPDGERQGQPMTRRELKGMKTFPQFNQMMTLDVALRGLEHEFGMTPSARSKIRITSEGSIGKDPSHKPSRGRFQYRNRQQ